MPPKGKGRNAQGAPHTAFHKKRAKKSTSKKQVPIASSPVLDDPFGQDLDSGSQVTDLNGLEGVIDILVDISSNLQAMERGWKT